MAEAEIIAEKAIADAAATSTESIAAKASADAAIKASEDAIAKGSADAAAKASEAAIAKASADSAAKASEAAAAKLIESPSSSIKTFISDNLGTLTAIGLTGVGAALYFGIQAGKGKSPSQAYNDLVQGVAGTTQDLVGAANSTAASLLAPIANASGLTGFIDSIKSFIAKYKIVFIIVLVVCILSSMSAVVLKFT